MTNDMEEIRQKLSNAATSPFWIKIQPLTKSIPHYDIASFFLETFITNRFWLFISLEDKGINPMNPYFLLVERCDYWSPKSGLFSVYNYLMRIIVIKTCHREKIFLIVICVEFIYRISSAKKQLCEFSILEDKRVWL